MRTTFIIIFTFISLACFSQAPGYMGKKITVTYVPTFNLSFIDLGGYYSDIPPVGIHVRHDITASYAISTGVTLGFGFKYLPTRFYDIYQVTQHDIQTGDDYYEGFNG